MKKEFSAIELHFLVLELKYLANSRVDKIYQPKKDEILIQVHRTGIGKRILRIAGKFLYLTEHKPENPQTPFGFCVYLRKKLSNSVLKEIRQIGSERIAEFLFETRGAELKLIAELFGAGNIILADEKNTIMSPMNILKFKDREIRPGKEYTFPKKEYNLFEITEKELSGLLKKSKQESLVKALALDLGLGGTYAEEVCMLSKAGKNGKPASADAKAIYSALKKLLSRNPEPAIVLKDDEVVDITPFKLGIYADYKQKKERTYNSALDSVITEHFIVKEKAEEKKIANKELDKIKKSISMQEKNIEKQRENAETDHRKGEIIYEKYAEIKNILDGLKKAREKYTWKEIKEKLKGHKVIKEINEKEGKVVIEV